jgi:hypothetical protein
MKRLIKWAAFGLMMVVVSKGTFDYAQSIGKHPLLPAPHGRPVAPNVVGLGSEEAVQLLNRKGFSTVEVFVPNESARPGTVFLQTRHRSTHASSRQVEKLLISGHRASSCHTRQPRTTLRLTTRLHSPELVPRCIVAAAGRRLTLIFRDNLVGAPANLSIYPDTSSTFVGVDGQFVVTAADRARALFIGHRSWLPKRVTYHVGPLNPGTYVVQGDSYPSLMRADLVARPTT